MMTPRASQTSMSPSVADAIAVKAFAFMAENQVHLALFLQETGIEPETVRKAAKGPAFLRGVLDYILAESDVLLDAVEALGVAPEVIASAARSMSKPQPKAAMPEPASPKAGGKPRVDKVDPYPTLPRRSLVRDRRPGEAA